MTALRRFEAKIQKEPAAVKLNKIKTAEELSIKMMTWLDLLNQFLNDSPEEEAVNLVIDQLTRVANILRPDQKTMAWEFADKLNELKHRLIAADEDYSPKKIDEIEEILRHSTEPENYPTNNLEECSLEELRFAIKDNQKILLETRKQRTSNVTA